MVDEVYLQRNLRSLSFNPRNSVRLNILISGILMDGSMVNLNATLSGLKKVFYGICILRNMKCSKTKTDRPWLPISPPGRA